MTKHRDDRLSWDDHHMLLALITAQRSADPNTQVGACIVSLDNKILGLGYNGPPRDIAPCRIPWDRENPDPSLTKYPYITHAEVNAILNANSSCKDSKLYVTLFPCNECAKIVIQSGISEVIYFQNPYYNSWQSKTSEWMLNNVDVKLRKYELSNNAKQCLKKLFP